MLSLGFRAAALLQAQVAGVAGVAGFAGVADVAV